MSVQPSKAAHRDYLFVPMMPTPNGPLHLGHIAGPYLKVDVVARALRQHGHHVAVITTSDSFESHVQQSAAQYSVSVFEGCSRFHEEIRRDFEYMKIKLDAFINPAAEPWASRFLATHAKLTDELLANEQAHVVAERYLFDDAAGEPVLGFRLSGKCPSCDTPTVGFVCEACGLQVTTEMLVAPKGTETNHQLSWRTGHTVALRVRDTEGVKERIAQEKLPEAFTKAMTSALADDANLIRMTILGDHGVGPYRSGDRTYTLYNTYFGHALFCGEVYAELFGKSRNAFAVDSSVITATSCGLDNATDLTASIAFARSQTAYKAFDHSLGNFFLTLQGTKFSTSLRHAVFVADLMRNPRINVDAVRLFLCTISPEQRQADFGIDAFFGFYNTWFLPNVVAVVNDANVARGTAPSTPAPARFLVEFNRVLAQREHALSLESFSVRGCADAIRSYLTSPEIDCREASLAYWWLKGLALLAFPIMPDLCGRLWRELGHEGNPILAAFREMSSTQPPAESLLHVAPLERADVSWLSSKPLDHERSMSPRRIGEILYARQYLL